MIGSNKKIRQMIEETLNELVENKKITEDNLVVLMAESHIFRKWSEAEFILLSLDGKPVCNFKVPINPQGNTNLPTLYQSVILSYVKGLATSLKRVSDS